MNDSIQLPNRPKPQVAPNWKTVRTKGDIASLSQRDIRRMHPEDLVALIRLADVPLFRDRVNGHLPDLDRPTLERLAFLAQWTVQHQSC
jgi:hypothetical protein